MSEKRLLVMACATVIEELLPLLPEGVHHRVFDFGLHTHPAKLRRTLQEAIDAVAGEYETILLGYGLCSQAVIGLRANGCTLVVPRVDDCIALFLGSRSAYLAQAQQEPGTYYLTKGWIEAGDTPYDEYEQLVQRYGKERADYVIQAQMHNYKRLALINTGQYEIERYREYTRKLAERFGLRYEEIKGSDALLKKMIYGPWDDEFVVIKAGETILFEHFYDQGVPG